MTLSERRVSNACYSPPQILLLAARSCENPYHWMKARQLLLSGLVAVLTAVFGLYAVGRTLTRPVPAEIGPAPASLNAQPITFPSQSGSTIHGWLSRGDGTRGAILLLAGIRANRLSM